MNRYWVLCLVAAVGCSAGTALAGDWGYLPKISSPVIYDDAKPAPAPMPAAGAVKADTHVAAPVMMMDAPSAAGCDCKACDCKCRVRREHFTLCDYWEILCACFYCEK